MTGALRRKPKSTERFARKRAAILQAAAGLINRDGVKGLTLGGAAAEVGLSTTSVTYYFRRKDDLAAACMLEAIGELHAMAEAAGAAASLPERLESLFSLYLERQRQARTGEAPPLAALSDLRALEPDRRAEVAQAFMRMFRRLRQIFDADDLPGLSRGRRTARTNIVLEQLFWARTWLPRFPPEAYPQIAAQMADILAWGLAADGAAWAPRPLPLGDLQPSGCGEGARETFLLAATRLINRRGYRGASVDLISAELNVTKGSFYHHIRTKDDLVAACFVRTFETMGRAQALAGALDADAWTRLASAAALLAEFQLSAQGPLLRTAALSALPQDLQAQMVAQSDAVSARFAELIAQGVAEGRLRPVDPPLAAQMLQATLNACAELAYWVPDIRPKAAPAVFVRPMLMGLVSP